MSEILTAVALAGALVVGCSPTTGASGPSSDQESAPPVAEIEVPVFEGAWSDWFTTIYSSPNATAHQRQILSDGRITDAEYVQLRDDFQQCLNDVGLKVELYANGGFAVDESSHLSDSQVTEDAVPNCENKTVGSVAMLYEEIRRNPDQKDEATIVVDCLKRRGVVGEGYTPAEYQRDFEEHSGLRWSSTDVRNCSQDPLGLLDESMYSSDEG